MKPASLALTIGLIAAAACSDTTPESTPPPTLTLTVTPTTIPQNTEFHVKLATTNFTIQEISEEEETAIENGQAPADPTIGHYHVYIDSTDQQPVEEDGVVVEEDLLLPCAIEGPIEPGAHKVIARLHYSDHRIVEPEVTSSVDITVTAGDCSTGGT